MLGGLLLYFISPKVLFIKGALSAPVVRFFTAEHITAMLVAVVLITFGYSKAKKAPELNGHKIIFWYYVIATIFVMAAIPWPFMTYLGSKWF